MLEEYYSKVFFLFCKITYILDQYYWYSTSGTRFLNIFFFENFKIFDLTLKKCAYFFLFYFYSSATSSAEQQHQYTISSSKCMLSISMSTTHWYHSPFFTAHCYPCTLNLKWLLYINFNQHHISVSRIELFYFLFLCISKRRSSSLKVANRAALLEPVGLKGCWFTFYNILYATFVVDNIECTHCKKMYIGKSYSLCRTLKKKYITM